MSSAPRLALAALLVLAACAAPAPPAATPTQTLRAVRVLPSPTAEKEAAGTGGALPPRRSSVEKEAARPSAEERAILDFFARKQDALARGDREALVALLDPEAPAPFRAAQEELLAAARERHVVSTPQRRIVAIRSRGELREVEYLEADDQGRARRSRAWFKQVRGAGEGLRCPPTRPRCARPRGARGAAAPLLFGGPLEALRQAEPPRDALGAERVIETDAFRFVYYELDAPQVAATRALAEEWLATYRARLGARFAPRGRIEVRFGPTFETRPDLPIVASGAVRRGVLWVLSSSSMVVTEEPGVAWSRTLVGHELAHILLGTVPNAGGFLLVEGLPLWLTDDRRTPELERVAARAEVWDLERLLEGPESDAEFFPAYAQASSFVHVVALWYGEDRVIALWESAKRVRSFDAATREALGLSAAVLYRAWRDSVLIAPPFEARLAA